MCHSPPERQGDRHRPKKEITNFVICETVWHYIVEVEELLYMNEILPPSIS